MQKTILVAAAAALVTSASFAADRPAVSFSKDGRMAYAAPHGGGSVATHIRKPVSTVIFSNLASKYPKGLYFADEGSSLYGGSGGSQYVAVGFTPAANTTAMSVQLAVGNFGDGLNAFTVSIYSDKGGIPDKALASSVFTATPAFGTCCDLATGTFSGGVPLTGGTPYWVAVTLSSKQAKAGDDGAWMLATTDQIDAAPFAYNPNNTGWVSSPTILPPAVAVYNK